MDKEQQKDKIIEIVKKAIDDNSVASYGEDDIVSIDGNYVDHIAEEVAEAVYNFYKPIDKEPVGAMYIEGCRKGFFDRDNQVRTLATAIKELKDENAGLNRECNDYLAEIESIQRATAKNIAAWIEFRAFHGGYAEPVQNVLSELSDVIKRKYDVEVENDD